MRNSSPDGAPVDRPAYAIESVDNALRLLSALRDVGALRVTDAAAELGVARSTAHRLLGMLVYRGFAVQGPDRRYRPGPALGVAPASDRWAREVDAVARPHLDALAAACGETVNLLIRVGTQVRFVYSAEGHQLLRIGDRRGHVMAAELTAGGKVLLADCSDAQLRELYRGGAEDDAADTIDPADAALTEQQFDELLRDLDAVRRVGFAVNLERTEQGVAAFGVAVRAPDGRPLAAVTVTMPAIRYRRHLEDDLLGRLRAAAHAVSAEIASSPWAPHAS
ncbi:IclR family transcriptional regulator [Tsukamurella pseudospumae]|uniref:IclR family transcriptional regulator n=1 Tax=Tsukamurella pseudospumae TaxID=239498 RepID=A0A138AVN9_9ACTN|nr:IclR family transcriptional regulator [Tsukamurella pseudospumae]KXP14469.1 IclR family transcriptional regulator [Tsukamurella pseudospumae]